MEISLRMLLFSHLSDIPVHAECNLTMCDDITDFVAHLFDKYFDGVSSDIARCKEVSSRISVDWKDITIEELHGYCEEMKGLIPSDWDAKMVEPNAEYLEYKNPKDDEPVLGDVTDDEIDELINERGLTIDRLVDRVIQLNGIVGVGLIILGDGVKDYIYKHGGYQK